MRGLPGFFEWRLIFLAACLSSIGITNAAIGERGALPTTVSQWNVLHHMKPGDVIIQSHRGAGELAPENTTEAFELGWKLETIPEADLRTTSDGLIVAFHDANFDRVVKDVPESVRGKGVKDITWSELSKLDVGSWMGSGFVGRRVSLMDEIFALMEKRPDRRIYLDIKNVHLPDLAKLVKKHGVEKQVILAAPKQKTIQEWKALVPESDTLLWVGGTGDEIVAKFNEAAKSKFKDITQLQIHTHLTTGTTSVTRLSKNPFTVSDDFLTSAGNELRRHNVLFQTLPYEGSTKELYWKLLDLGLMSFATDHPDMTKAAITEYYQLSPAANSTSDH